MRSSQSRRSCARIACPLLIALACGCTQPPLTLVVERGGATGTVALRISIMVGGCEGGEVVYEGRATAPAWTLPDYPERLPPAHYAFEAIGLADDCSVTGTACVEVDLPGQSQVTLVLDSDASGDVCWPDRICVGGGACVDPSSRACRPGAATRCVAGQFSACSDGVVVGEPVTCSVGCRDEFQCSPLDPDPP